MLSKADSYTLFIKQMKGLLLNEEDLIANLANTAALYMEHFKPHWVGFYLVKGKELVLGPFQGPVACTRIAFGKGVCGKSWQNQQTIIVDNVHEFEGHIACSTFSNSEIVIPIIKNNTCLAVLDIDATSFGSFDEVDKEFLEEAVRLLY